jgi:NADH dehydrogenase
VVDSYSLKNASWNFKLLSTAGILGSVGLLTWSWTISLGVLKFNRPSEMCRLFGDDLWALARYQPGLFAMIFFFQAIAYSGIYLISRRLFQRTALRRRMKSLLLAMATGLVFLDQWVWATAPFVRLSQQTAGYIGFASAAALIALTLPSLFQMWFYKRWANTKGPKRVVIVGGGFAGLYTALGLDQALGYRSDLEITLIDRKNYFLFPPLLPSAAVGTIETRQVTYPYRRIFETTNIRYKKATVTEIDPQAQQISFRLNAAEEYKQPYDYLVLAPGSVPQTFNTPGVREHAFFVRELNDAIRIRNRIIDQFEFTAVLQDEAAKREWLRFVIVGAGPTGIEIATEIHDLIQHVLLKRYPEIDRSWPEVVIIQAGPQILPGWPDKVVQMTLQQLSKLGIRLIMNDRVTRVGANEVMFQSLPAIKTRTILWCAGIQPSTLLKSCGLPLDKSSRVPTDPCLRAAGFPNVFVLGDSASCLDQSTRKPLPPLGQVAFQQGSHTAKNLIRLLRQEPLEPFHYFNYGSLVSVGEHYAAAELLGFKFAGFIGWFIWRTLYLAKIIGFSNKIRVMTDWTLDLLIERSISQLQESETVPDQLKKPETIVPAIQEEVIS